MEAEPGGVLYLPPFFCSSLNVKTADEVSIDSSSAIVLSSVLPQKGEIKTRMPRRSGSIRECTALGSP